jgi:hypothetical protein
MSEGKNKAYMFNTSDAEEYGVDAAVMLYNIRHWSITNKANGNNLIDGKYWTYNTVKAFQEIFPFWTTTSIRRILKNLEAKGAIISDYHSKNTHDRTKWYALAENAIPASDDSISANQELHSRNPVSAFAETDKSINQNQQIDLAETANESNIQIVNTDSKPDRKPPSRFEKALFYARSLFNKRPATALDRSETIAARNAKTVLCELTDEDWGYLSLFYQAPQSETFARKSLATFLNNINGELANAKAWHNNLAPSPSYSRAPDDPADWQRLRDEVCDDLEAQGIPIEKLAGQRTETRYLSLKCSIRDDINAKIKETFA